VIEKIWYSNHWIGTVLLPILWPLSRLYRYITESRREAFQQGRKLTYRAPVPVIIVGNITAGGNGKTPMVIWLVEQLQRMGLNPGVISRGYGGKSPNYPLLITQETPVVHCGDEPKLIYQRTGAPVAVAPRRIEAVNSLLPLGVDVIVADDGLQHYALERDIEIVVVDGQRRFGNQQFMPLGPLRESLQRLKTVDIVINNGCKAEADEISMVLVPQQAVNLYNGHRIAVDKLPNLVAFAGIGHPSRFFQTLSRLNASLVARQAFSDHYNYTFSDLEPLCRQGDHVVMTEKDAVKCTPFSRENWWFLPVSATFRPEDERRILKLIEEVIKHYGSPSA
jgi:tetraacyldisaccharide 4'-kinase